MGVFGDVETLDEAELAKVKYKQKNDKIVYFTNPACRP
jgi:hypothetical protein